MKAMTDWERAEKRRLIGGAALMFAGLILSLAVPDASTTAILAIIVGGTLMLLPLANDLRDALREEFHPEPERPSLRVEVERLCEKFPHLVINVEAFPRWEAREDD